MSVLVNKVLANITLYENRVEKKVQDKLKQKKAVLIAEVKGLDSELKKHGNSLNYYRNIIHKDIIPYILKMGYIPSSHKYTLEQAQNALELIEQVNTANKYRGRV